MEIVKRCAKHGELTLEGVIKSGRRHIKQDYKCKQCMKELRARYYAENKEKVLAKHKAWRNADPARTKRIRNASAKKRRPFQPSRKERAETAVPRKFEWLRKQIDSIGDSYIKKILIRKSNLTREDIPQEIVEVKREIIKLHRKINDKDNKKV